MREHEERERSERERSMRVREFERDAMRENVSGRRNRIGTRVRREERRTRITMRMPQVCC